LMGTVPLPGLFTTFARVAEHLPLFALGRMACGQEQLWGDRGGG